MYFTYGSEDEEKAENTHTARSPIYIIYDPADEE